MASRGKRLLIGCGLGCGTLIVLVVIAVVIFSVWINQPGDLLQPRQLLGRETTGYVEWTLRLEDPGTEGFAAALIETMAELPPEAENELPDWLAGFIKNRQRKEAEQDVRKMFPMVLAWTYQPGGEPEDDLHVVSASIERIGHQLVFADWILGFFLGKIPEATVVTHEKEKIYQLPVDKDTGRLTFFLHRGNFFLTSDAGSARLAVDRLHAEPRDRAPSELERLFDATATGGTLRGAFDNADGRLSRLISQLPFVERPADSETDPWAAIHSAHLTGGLTADGSMAGTLDLTGPDSDWAIRLAPAADRAVRSIFDGTELPLELSTTPSGSRIRIDFRIEDIPGWLAHLRDHGVEFRGSKIRID